MDSARFMINASQLPYDPNRLLPDDTNILVLDEDGSSTRKSSESFGREQRHGRRVDRPYDILDDDQIEPDSTAAVLNDDPESISSPMANNLVAGILDAETVSKHMSKIGKTADGSTIAYLTLTLPVIIHSRLSLLSNIFCS